MKTTYAPKFPELKFLPRYYRDYGFSPLHRYEMLIAMRNAKVSIGAKLNYGS